MKIQTEDNKNMNGKKIEQREELIFGFLLPHFELKVNIRIKI